MAADNLQPTGEWAIVGVDASTSTSTDMHQQISPVLVDDPAAVAQSAHHRQQTTPYRRRRHRPLRTTSALLDTFIGRRLQELENEADSAAQQVAEDEQPPQEQEQERESRPVSRHSRFSRDSTDALGMAPVRRVFVNPETGFLEESTEPYQPLTSPSPHSHSHQSSSESSHGESASSSSSSEIPESDWERILAGNPVDEIRSTLLRSRLREMVSHVQELHAQTASMTSVHRWAQQSEQEQEDTLVRTRVELVDPEVRERGADALRRWRSVRRRTDPVWSNNASSESHEPLEIQGRAISWSERISQGNQDAAAETMVIDPELTFAQDDDTITSSAVTTHSRQPAPPPPPSALLEPQYARRRHAISSAASFADIRAAARQEPLLVEVPQFNQDGVVEDLSYMYRNDHEYDSQNLDADGNPIDMQTARVLSPGQAFEDRLDRLLESLHERNPQSRNDSSQNPRMEQQLEEERQPLLSLPHQVAHVQETTLLSSNSVGYHELGMGKIQAWMRPNPTVNWTEFVGR